MRRNLLTVVLLAAALQCARAQEVVIDPSQIAASASNAAEQIDYMLDQLSELSSLGDKLGDVKDYIDDVFGEDGVGGKALGVMQDLGTLDRLTDSFNSTMRMTEAYAGRIRACGRLGLADTNAMLSYLNSAKRQAETAIAMSRKILSTMGFTKKEKKDELEKMVADMERSNRRLSDAMEVEIEASFLAEGLGQFIRSIDAGMSTRQVAEDGRTYGSATGAAQGSLGVISMLLALLGVISTAWGLRRFVLSPGDPGADMVFLRIGEALIAGTFVLSLLSSFFHMNL